LHPLAARTPPPMRLFQLVARLQYSTDQQRSLASHRLSKSMVNRPDMYAADSAH
jgi:hypothetical protein